MDETVAEQVAQARREWASSLLPALDGLERAIASGGRFLSSQEPNDGGGALPTEQLTNWLEGLEFVRQRLLAVLEEGGVVPIEALGRRFDPHLHVAVDTAAEGADEPGTIVEEERRGYRLGEEVLRYAEVVVYRSQAERDGAK
jgi:molecular chaperone GrpE